jgi:hypothetical protein
MEPRNLTDALSTIRDKIPGLSSERPTKIAVPDPADKFKFRSSHALPRREVISSEGPTVPHRIARQRAEQETGATYVPEDVDKLFPGSNIPKPVTPEQSTIGPAIAEGYTKTTLFNMEFPSLGGAAIPALPLVESIHHRIAVPSQRLFKSEAHLPVSGNRQDYRLLQNREYTPAPTSYRNAGQPAPELPMPSGKVPKTDLSVGHGDELFRKISDTIPELTHSRNQNVPELALARVGRQAETEATTEPATAGPTGERSSENVAPPDLDDLARRVYPVIRRMLAVERERRATW